MWQLFPELVGPMIAAFVAGSFVAWLLVLIVLRRRPQEEPPRSPGQWGPR